MSGGPAHRRHGRRRRLRAVLSFHPGLWYAGVWSGRSMIGMLQTKTAVSKLSPQPNEDRTRGRVDDASVNMYQHGIAIVPAVDDGTKRSAIGRTSLIAARMIRIVARSGTPFDRHEWRGKKGRDRSAILSFAVVLAHARQKPPPGGKLAVAVGWIYWIVRNQRRNGRRIDDTRMTTIAQQSRVCDGAAKRSSCTFFRSSLS
jgi:hypothetical protein